MTNVRRLTTGLLALALTLLAPTVAAAQTDTVIYYHTDAIGSVRLIHVPKRIVPNIRISVPLLRIDKRLFEIERRIASSEGPTFLRKRGTCPDTRPR